MITGWDGCDATPTLVIEAVNPRTGEPVGKLFLCEPHRIRGLIHVVSRGLQHVIGSSATKNVACGQVKPPTQDELIIARSR